MFRRLLVLCIFICGGLFASAQEINQLAGNGKIFDAAKITLSENSIHSANIENPVLQNLYNRSRYWSNDRRAAFLQRIGLTATLDIILVELAKEQSMNGDGEPRLLGDQGRQGAFYKKLQSAPL